MLILGLKGLIKMASSLLPFPPQTASTCRRLVFFCDGTAFECFPHVGCVPENVKKKTVKEEGSVDKLDDFFFHFRDANCFISHLSDSFVYLKQELRKQKLN